MVPKKQSRVKRIAKRVGAGALVVGVAAVLTAGALKLHSIHAATKKARIEWAASRGAKELKAWEKLPLSRGELIRLQKLRPETLKGIEKIAAELKFEKNGVQRVLNTLWYQSDVLKSGQFDAERERTWHIQLNGSKPGSPERLQAERVLAIRKWASQLQEETKIELLALVKAAKD